MFRRLFVDTILIEPAAVRARHEGRGKWYADVKRADWKTPAEIKAVYRNASFIANNRVVFNVKGNQYRLIVAVQYQHGIVYIRCVGTHQDYDRIDAASI